MYLQHAAVKTSVHLRLVLNVLELDQVQEPDRKGEPVTRIALAYARASSAVSAFEILHESYQCFAAFFRKSIVNRSANAAD